MVMELENGSGNIAFAEHQNQQMVAARSNYVLSGLVVTAAVGSNLLDSSDDVDISDGYCFNNNTLRDLSGGSSPASIDLSTAYGGLSTGQSRYVFIYVNTSGTVVSVAGDVATTGQQLPPDIVDKTVVLAMITLTHLDTTVDAPDIEDWQIQNPIGSAMGDNEKSSWGDDGDLSVYHDNAHAYVVNTTGDIKFSTGKISLSVGTNVNEFSIDGTLNGNSDDVVPTEKAVKTYVDAAASLALADLSDVSLTGPQLEDSIAFGAGNTVWEVLSYFGAVGNNATFLTNGLHAINTGVAFLIFYLNVPTNLGTIGMSITGLSLPVSVAGANEFVDSLNIYGVNEDGTDTLLTQDTTTKKTAGEYLFTFTAEDVSSYRSVRVIVVLDNTTTVANCIIRPPSLRYYYS